jgi:phage terminase small subunit
VALTTKQQAFVEFYLMCWNASEAARRAEYTGQANVVGPRLLANVSIQAAIQERLAELKMSADEVLTRLTDHARATADDFLTIERVKRRDMQPVMAVHDNGEEELRFVPGPEYEVVEARLDLEKTKARGKLHLIKEIKDGKDGLTVRLHDAQAALTKLGEHHRLWVQRQELSGAEGAPIEVSDARTRLLARLARGAADADEGGDSGSPL